MTDERTTNQATRYQYDGRLPSDPLPTLSQPKPPEPNAEDEAAAAASGGRHDAAYFADMRTVRTADEWAAARVREGIRQGR